MNLFHVELIIQLKFGRLMQLKIQLSFVIH